MFIGELAKMIVNYLNDFPTAMAEVGWPDQALLGIYLQSLNETMKDQLALEMSP